MRVIRYKPDAIRTGSGWRRAAKAGISFDFQLTGILNRLAGDIADLEASRLHGDRTTGIRALRKLLRLLRDIQADEHAQSLVPEVPDADWLTRQVRERRFLSAYCPTCGKSYSRGDIKRTSSRIAGHKTRSGYGYGGASGIYLGCPLGHTIHVLRERIS